MMSAAIATGPVRYTPPTTSAGGSPLSASPSPEAGQSPAASSRYEMAVQKLNKLQSNALTIQKLKASRKEQMQLQNVPETESCLHRLGITIPDLDRLRVIHVTGTKGKGSTCAYTEAMLRSVGIKTGFFSSPHMVHVRERIRIGGAPLPEDAFADALFAAHDRLEKIPPADSSLPPMPAYFKFLTVLAFDVFLREQVDVAIVEVGIGGEYDCTNVTRAPVACGITTLDLDHVALLGNTLSDIAWNKAGIFKPNATAVVAHDHTEEAMARIRERATERKVRSLSTCPPLTEYSFPVALDSPFRPGIDGDHQKTNLSLALQLARAWIRSERPEIEHSLFGGADDSSSSSSSWECGQPFHVPAVWADAIAACHWPGRSQILDRGRTRFYLDGAHTSKSMESCVRWFQEASRDRIRSPASPSCERERILIFHCTGDRKPDALMAGLAALPFTRVLLCPPMVRPRQDSTSDTANYFRPPDEQTRQSMECEAAWRRLRPDMDARSIIRLDCVSHALDEVARGDNEADVLVTGSLILVGNVLSALGYDR